MHFRNVPCAVEPNNPRNPLNILRRLYKPGDYVAFKLVSNHRIQERPKPYAPVEAVHLRARRRCLGLCRAGH
jgi:hypothetical protein